jgi:radical SAM protein with 4Fe4S-binding SPASM domain
MKRWKAAARRWAAPVQRWVPPALRDAIYRHSAEFFISTLGLRAADGSPSMTSTSLDLVHIETRTMCNGQCTFCAAAVQYKSRPDEEMPEALFEKIILDIAAMGYRIRISPYCNNEPLLDRRMPRFLSFARTHCPNAILELKTNGVVLKEETLHVLAAAGLDYLNINDYHTSPKITERLQDLCVRYPTLGRMRCIYTPRRSTETMGIINRAGTNPTMPALTRPLDVFCARPFEVMTIAVDGAVSTCSTDLFFRNSYGNVREASVAELWQSAALRRLRADLLAHRRGNLAACRDCDYRGFDAQGVRGKRLPLSSRLFPLLDRQT